MSEEITVTNDTGWAGGVHVAALLTAVFTSWCAGCGGMLAAFIVWLMKKDESPFIRKHAAEAFNFNFSMFIYALIAIVFSIFTLGLGLLVVIPLALVFFLVWLVCTIIAAKAGFDGREYRYPLSFRILS